MQHRIEAARRRFRSLGVANFLVTKFENYKETNIGYLCGYTGSNGLLLITRQKAYFLTDGRYANQANSQITGAEVHICSGGNNSVESFVRELKNNRQIRFRGRIGIEADNTSAGFAKAMQSEFPDSELVQTHDVIEMISSVREPVEIDAIRQATAITDRVYADILPLVKPGVSERDLAAEITYRHMKYGAQKNSFDPIVASGLRSALPHGIATDKKIEKGDFVTFDIGCLYNGYASDMTRTVVVGKATAEMKKIYGIVKSTEWTAVQAVAAGMKCADIDGLARKIITVAGYGDKFTHSLGHGLGHVVHAKPVLSRMSKERLKVGNVVTVEPGIYIEDLGGVRIEDDVLVTEEGREVLTKTPRELLEL